MDYAALKSELTTDPTALGYAPLIAIGSDQGLVELLNQISSVNVTMPSLTRDQFLIAILPAGLVLPTLDAAIQAKWDRLIGLACAAQSILLATISALVSLGVSDGLLTTDQAAAIGQRPGSRAEVLFGAETTVSLADIGIALRGS